jgi:phosphoenolpyruvate---glycerone phosphotransferase subunit DhaL
VNGRQLVERLRVVLPVWSRSAEELRDLDAAIGDGDLGITVTKGVDAVLAKLDGLGEEPSPADVLRASAAGFAGGNPSTMAALVGGALLAAAKAVREESDIGAREVLLIAEAAAEAIMIRGKAQLGDKTILDAIVPSLEPLRGAEDGVDPLPAMIAAAEEAVRRTTPWQSRRGRAAWVGERSIGHPDPGAMAYQRLLEAFTNA